MEERLYFKKEKIDSFDELILKFNSKEFRSPYRSTIPLLALYKNYPGFCFELADDTSQRNAKYSFEFETPVGKGKGRASCTDLIIEFEMSCIAVEAKWTEPAYHTVKSWLGDSLNKKQVLEGWLEMISAHTGIFLHYESVADLPYQLIHRVASACSLEKVKTNVVYLCFDLNEAKREYYYRNLKKMSDILENKINFYLSCFKISKLEEQTMLESSWKSGVRDLSEFVVKGLKSSLLMSVSQLTLEKINS